MMEPIGSYFVRNKILTYQQVEDALQNQSILGGKLGTNLIELGYLSLEHLEQCLSHYFQVPMAFPKVFDEINTNLLLSIPKRLIEKYKFLPLRREQGKLYVATGDPMNEAMLDELSGVLAIKIEPLVTSEIRILFYLGQYCQIPTEIRIRSLLFHHMKSKVLGKALPPPEIQDGGKRDLLKKGFRPLNQGEELTNEGFEDFLMEQAVARDVPKEEARPAHANPPPHGEPNPEFASLDRTPQTKEVSSAGWREDLLTLEDLNGHLKNIHERDQISEIALQFAKPFVEVCVLFSINSGLVTGWNATGRHLSKDTVKTVIMPLSADSVFHTVSQSNTYFYGRLSPSGLNLRLLAALDLNPNQEILVIPVSMKKRLVNILLLDPGKKGLPQPNLTALVNLSLWLPKAYEHLILERKNALKRSLEGV